MTDDGEAAVPTDRHEFGAITGEVVSKKVETITSDGERHAGVE